MKLPQASPQILKPRSSAPDPGVAATRLINRDEIRISRVVLQAGAVRSVHAHTDVEYHAWIPLEGVFELTVGTDARRCLLRPQIKNQIAVSTAARFDKTATVNLNRSLQAD